MLAERQKTLVIGDLSLKPGFTSIPNAVIFAPGLSANAKQTYATLLSYAWKENECFPGQERLAEALEVSLRTVQRYLDELRAYGLISWRQQGLNQPNIYTINDLRDVKALQIADTTPVTCPDTSNLSCQDTTPVSYEEYSVIREDDYTTYNHPDRRLTAPPGGSRKAKPDATENGLANNKQQTVGQPILIANKGGNREIIAELVDNYRSIGGVKPLKGDYAFIGGLYNEFGYRKVYEALNKLELTMAAEEIEKPLLYLRGILVPVPSREASIRVRKRPVESEQDRKRREFMKTLYSN